jgi:hypothetical protein
VAANRDDDRPAPQECRDLGIELFGEAHCGFGDTRVEEVLRQASEAFRTGAENLDILA